MIPVISPTTPYRQGPTQIPRTDTASLQTSPTAAIVSTHPITVHTENCSQVRAAALLRSQSRPLLYAQAKSTKQSSQADPAESQSATPSGAGENATSSENDRGAYVHEDSVNPVMTAKIPNRPLATESTKSKAERNHQLTGASGRQIRSAGGDDQGRLTKYRPEMAGARPTPTAVSAIELLKAPHHSSQTRTMPPTNILPIAMRLTKASPRSSLMPFERQPYLSGKFEASRRRLVVDRPLRLGPPKGVNDSGLFNSLTSQYSFGLRSFKIGIETQFYLAALDPMRNRGTLEHFVRLLTKTYNAQMSRRYPRMRESVRPQNYTGPYTQWCLVRDENLQSDLIPWGIELVSPIFRAFPGSIWRDDVEAIWGYLLKKYEVIGSPSASTHIHIGLEPEYTLTDLKRIAQAVIHFEPAFEILLPRCRSGNSQAKSNWLNGPGLARDGKSRLESIAVIEAILDFDVLFGLLQPFQPSGDSYDKSLCWNFSNLHTTRSIEFRKPPVSTTAEDALCWAELALSFVQASTCCESPEALQRIPPTVGGLRWFLWKLADIPGVNEPVRLERLWEGKDPDATLQPTLENVTLSDKERPVLEPRLRKQVAEEEKRVQTLIKRGQGRYW